MRTFVLPLLLLAGLSPVAPAQDTFQDPDFGASMTIPFGMREITAEERARVTGVSVEEARNMARGESPTGKVSHAYIWIDEHGPYNRQISLHLYDNPPPFRSPAQLKEAHEQEGMAVDYEEILPPPLNGVRIEGTFLRKPDNVAMRRSVVYVPDVPRERFALLSIQAYAGDWDIVKPELLKVVQSLKLEGIRMGGQSPRPPAGGRNPNANANAAPADDGSAGDWGRLEVVGSLLLAAILLGSLVLGGRTTP
jgi:hypothetical protein